MWISQCFTVFGYVSIGSENSSVNFPVLTWAKCYYTMLSGPHFMVPTTWSHSHIFNWSIHQFRRLYSAFILLSHPCRAVSHSFHPARWSCIRWSASTDTESATRFCQFRVSVTVVWHPIIEFALRNLNSCTEDIVEFYLVSGPSWASSLLPLEFLIVAHKWIGPPFLLGKVHFCYIQV